MVPFGKYVELMNPPNGGTFDGIAPLVDTTDDGGNHHDETIDDIFGFYQYKGLELNEGIVPPVTGTSHVFSILSH